MTRAPTLCEPSGLIKEAGKSLGMGGPEKPKVMAAPVLWRSITTSPEANSAAASSELIVTSAESRSMGPEYEPPLRDPGVNSISPAGKPRRVASESGSGIEMEPSWDSSLPVTRMPGIETPDVPGMDDTGLLQTFKYNNAVFCNVSNAADFDPLLVTMVNANLDARLPVCVALNGHQVDCRSEERRVGKECRSRW